MISALILHHVEDPLWCLILVMPEAIMVCVLRLIAWRNSVRQDGEI